MKRHIDVHRGEVMAGKGEVVLESDDNRACLVIAAHDATNKIGALAHAMFRNGSWDKKFHSSVMKDTSNAIDEMIEDMALLGADKEDIVVKLVTGENIHHEEHDFNYDRNVASAIDILREKHIKMQEDLEDDVGENVHVILDVETGELSFK